MAMLNNQMVAIQLQYILVGGLEHLDYDFPSLEFYHPNWLSLHHFSEGLKLNHQPAK